MEAALLFEQRRRKAEAPAPWMQKGCSEHQKEDLGRGQGGWVDFHMEACLKVKVMGSFSVTWIWHFFLPFLASVDTCPSRVYTGCADTTVREKGIVFVHPGCYNRMP